MCDVCVTCLTSFRSLLGEQEQNRKEKYPQDQKRLRVINALGHAYSSISLVNLKTEEIEIVKSSKDIEAGSARGHTL